jgi:SAM-dependent methyltransferase
VTDYPVLGSVSVPCLCGSEDDSLVFLATDQISWKPGYFKVVKCRVCGLVRTNPRPSSAELSSYYPEDYGPYVPISRGIIRRLIKKVIPPSRDSEIPGFDSPGRALELGCSNGMFLDSLREDGWSVTGVEYSEEAAVIARGRGHEVFAGRVEDQTFAPNSYDLVVAWMVVEHLTDPVLALSKAHEWTNSDGRLALSVPNIESTSFRLFGKHWFNLQVPTHFNHFSPETIGDLLDRCGWQLDEVKHQVTFRTFVESARLKVYRKPVPESLGRVWALVSNASTILGLPFAVYFASRKKSDRITVWASKQKAD